MIRRLRLCGLLICLVASACTSETTSTTETAVTSQPTAVSSIVSSGGPKPIIVDYSPTVSDVGGLMYLLSHPDVEVVAITLPGTGEAGCDLGVEVTLGILDLLDVPEIPVACDPSRPDGSNDWPQEFLEGHENLLFGLTEELNYGDSGTGPDLLVETIKASPVPVTIYAVAPLTNVARALDFDPGIAGNIEELVIMGGAVDVGGNVFGSTAEWNLHIDPDAASAVLASGVPVTLVPLDATNDVPVESWYPTALSRAERSPQITYLSQLVRIFPAVTSNFYFFWDELAALVVTDDVGVAVETATLKVEDDGSTVRHPDGHEVQLVSSVEDPEAFYTEFISRLAGARLAIGESTPEESAYLMAVAGSLTGLEPAFAALSPFFNDAAVTDPDGFADTIDGLFDVLDDALALAEGLAAPESLRGLHEAYVAELAGDLAQRDTVVGAIRAAESIDDVFFALGGLSAGEACEALANQAFFLGVEVGFACNP